MDYSEYFQAALGAFGELGSVSKLPDIVHVFSHFKLEIQLFLCGLKQRSNCIAEATHVWYPLERCAQAPLPAPIKKLLLQVPLSMELL